MGLRIKSKLAVWNCDIIKAARAYDVILADSGKTGVAVK